MNKCFYTVFYLFGLNQKVREDIDCKGMADEKPFQRFLCSMQALGRPFQLGDLYDYRTDRIIKDIHLITITDFHATLKSIPFMQRIRKFRDKSSPSSITHSFQTKGNIKFLLTFSDTKDPPILAAIKEAGLVSRIEGRHYNFNSPIISRSSRATAIADSKCLSQWSDNFLSLFNSLMELYEILPVKCVSLSKQLLDEKKNDLNPL